MRKIITTLLIGTLILFSCSKSSDGDSTNNPGTTPGACSGTPGALFTSVSSIVQTNCALSGCHTGSNAQNGINFSDNCTIVAQKDRIKVRAVDQAGTASQMPLPPRAPLSAADRQKITDWIAAGGKLTD